MTELKLTTLGPGATSELVGYRGQRMDRRRWKAGLTGLGLIATAGLLGGCINIAAPEEPIVIELNVNIRAEVLYRLAEDASNTIDENADIF